MVAILIHHDILALKQFLAHLFHGHRHGRGLVHRVPNTAANTLGGAIVNHNTPNPTSLFKTGPGTWELGGVSTFTGGLSLDAGTLTLKSGASLAATNALTVDGGTLNLLNAAVRKLPGQDCPQIHKRLVRVFMGQDRSVNRR